MTTTNLTNRTQLRNYTGCLMYHNLYATGKADRGERIDSTTLSRQVKQLKKVHNKISQMAKTITPNQQKVQALEARIKKMKN